MWPIFETACSLKIVALSFQGHCNVPRELQKSKPFYYIHLDCTCIEVVKVRSLFLNEKDMGVKNIVETFYDADFSRQD